MLESCSKNFDFLNDFTHRGKHPSISASMVTAPTNLHDYSSVQLHDLSTLQSAHDHAPHCITMTTAPL